jgi:hypothetical protein
MFFNVVMQWSCMDENNMLNKDEDIALGQEWYL